MTRENSSIFIFLFILPVFIGGYYPFIGLFLLFILSFLLNGKNSILLVGFTLALLLGLFASILDLNGKYEGDVQKYYYYYNTFGWSSALLKAKFYRAAMFFLMEMFNLRDGFYSFISIFLIYFNLTFGTKKILDLYCLEIKSIKQKLIFILTLLASVKLIVFSGFENILSFSFVFLSFAYLLHQRHYTSILFSLLSVLVHASSFILVLFLIFAYFLKSLKQNKIMIIIISTFVSASFILLGTYQFNIGVPLIDYEVEKFFIYFNGPWSKYSIIEKYVELPYLILLLFVYPYIIYLVRDNFFSKIEFNFLSLIFIFCLLLFFNRMVGIRYLGFSIIFFLPYVYMIIMKCKIPKHLKFSILGIVLLLVFSLSNIRSIYGYQLLMKVGDGNFPLMNLVDIYNFKINVPTSFTVDDRKEE